MRYYVEINGISSLTLEGFAIKELPPISKPPIRTQKEEIDGRDGDIITKLGYGAYDKQIEVGLYGDFYDINKIIAFFNSEGIVTFSNEPDKYYNFTIVNQIDFEKLLRFKTATITFHCQPFKYKKDEEPISIEYQYVEGEGTELTLDNTSSDKMSLELYGNTSQKTTTGKNLLNATSSGSHQTGLTITRNQDGSYTLNGTNTGSQTEYTRLCPNFTLPAGTYTLSNGNSNVSNTNFIFYDDRGNFGRTDISTRTFSSSVEIAPYIKVGAGVTVNNQTIYPMIETGSSKTDYEPYTGGVPSPNPDYPQNINVVSGDNEVFVESKNILDEKGLINASFSTGVYLYTKADFKGNRQLYSKARLKENKSRISGLYVAISSNGDNPNSGVSRFVIRDGYPMISDALMDYTGYENLYIAFYPRTYTWQQIYENYDIWVSSVDTTYEPYAGQASYSINLPVENLLNVNTLDNAGGSSLTVDISNNEIKMTQSGSSTYQYRSFMTDLDINKYKGKTINFSYKVDNTNSRVFLALYKSDKTLLGDLQSTSYTIPSDTTASYIGLQIYQSYSTGVNGTVTFSELQIEKGTKANSYTPYGTTPIELCKIDNYKDIFLKENDKWYKHKFINKYILDGSTDEGWLLQNTNYFRTAPVIDTQLDTLYCNMATYITLSDLSVNTNNRIAPSGGNRVWCRFSQFNNDVDTFKTYLATNNMLVYTIANTPTKEEITYQPLIDQLNNIKNAVSYNEQTNISQVNNDLPFIIKATAKEYGSDRATITNEGNIYSKPILNVVGSGTINVDLNGNQIFILDLSDSTSITIDPEQLEAYNPRSMNLMNRKVTGDISNLKLPEGENELSISGNLTNATITKYSRWL